MPIAELDGVTLHYLRSGEGPALLLIAGIPAVAGDWEPFAERMRSRRRVIAYDNRGSGGSSVPAGPYTTALMADDAAGLLDHLGLERADVFGISMGGMIAQELALRHPRRVRRLVLGCTHAGIAHAERQPLETARAFAMQTDDWGERMRALAPFAFRPGADAAMLARFIEKKTGDAQPPEGYSSQIQAVLGHDTLDRLGDVAAPTLVVTGDEDQVIPTASSRPLVEGIPGARLRLIEGTGHLFFIERPDETAEAIGEFLDAPEAPES